MLSRHTKRALLGLLFAGAILVLVAAASRHYFASRALAIRLEQERAAMVPPEPMLLRVERADRSRTRAFAARLHPFRTAQVAADASGRIIEVLVEVGDEVGEGQLLVRLDPTIAEMNLAAARAGLEAAETQLRELRRQAAEAERLAEAETIPETQREAARSQVEVQAAEVERLRAEVNLQQELLDRHEIRAPFDGSVNQRHVEPGERVNAGQPVVRVAMLDPLRARFQVSDLEVGSFRQGDILQLSLQAFPDKELEAMVSAVAKSVDPATGLFPIEARVPNEGRSLPGGLSGTVRANIQQYDQALFIPASAVRFEGKRALCEVWEDGETVLRDLDLGPEVDGLYPVLSGLEEGELVVVR